MSLEQFADLAVAAGYQAICMRASLLGVQSPEEKVRDAQRILGGRGLGVSMISGDLDIVYNNSRGPLCLRNIVPYLDLAESLGAPMIRVCIKADGDIIHAQKAADLAAERGLKLVHQCHVQSLFETPCEIVERLQEIGRPNFGLIFEAANLEQCGQGYGAATLAQLAPWIENVYLQNQQLRETGSITLETWCNGPISLDVCEIYESGGIDFASIFAGLRQIGYSGPITVHQSAPDTSRLSVHEAATQTAKYLQRLACEAQQ